MGPKGSRREPYSGHKIHGFGYPDLLYQEGPTNAEPLQASLESVGILFEETLQNHVVLDYHVVSWMRGRPFPTVFLEHLKLGLKFGGSGSHWNPSKLI